MKYLIFGLLVLTLVFVSTECQAIFPPTQEEKELCDKNANGREVKEVTKSRRLSCDVICTYKDDSKDTHKSPVGTLCTDMGGNLPTGRCNAEGACPPGSLK